MTHNAFLIGSQGVCVGWGRCGSLLSLYSAALILAGRKTKGSTVQAYLFSLDDSESLYRKSALVVVRNGYPVPGYDMVGDRGFLFDRLAAFAKHNKSEIQLYGDVYGFTPFALKDLKKEAVKRLKNMHFVWSKSSLVAAMRANSDYERCSVGFSA
jgi:hypothetical protein